MEHIIHPIPPLYDEQSRILILGSFPSVKSREAQFFYGHPQNRFWKVLAAVLGCPLPQTVPEKQAMLQIERSRFFPEISFGYSRQDILPVKGLNAWTVGVSFPVWFLPQRSRIKQAKLAWSKAQVEADANRLALRNKVEELGSTLRRYGESVRYYQEQALPEAEQLQKTADLQFRESETDITEYIQSMNAAVEIQKGYIESVRQYNVAALEYELYHE